MVTAWDLNARVEKFAVKWNKKAAIYTYYMRDRLLLFLPQEAVATGF